MYTKEEYEKAVSEAFDRGYNAGHADALMDEQYLSDEPPFPDDEDIELEGISIREPPFTMVDRVD